MSYLVKEAFKANISKPLSLSRTLVTDKNFTFVSLVKIFKNQYKINKLLTLNLYNLSFFSNRLEAVENTKFIVV